MLSFTFCYQKLLSFETIQEPLKTNLRPIKAFHKMDEPGQNLVNRPPYNRVFLIKSHRPVRPLACPARFERATYALEAGKMSLNNSRDNGLSLAKKGVQYAPRTMVRGGIHWI
jgi:hypothetical protein